MVYSGLVVPLWQQPRTATKFQAIPGTFWGPFGSFVFVLFLCLLFLMCSPSFISAGGNWTKKEFEARLWGRGAGQPKGMWGTVTVASCVRTWGMLSRNRVSSWITQAYVNTCCGCSLLGAVYHSFLCAVSYLWVTGNPEGLLSIDSLTLSVPEHMVHAAAGVYCILSLLVSFLLLSCTGVWLVVTVRDPKRMANPSIGAICSQYPSVTRQLLDKTAWKVNQESIASGPL